MEGNPINSSIVSIVMLDEFSQTGIPDFDCAIDGRSGYAGAIRRKFAAENFGFVLGKGR